MSANQKPSDEGRRTRARTPVALRLDDLIALKEVKGGHGSVVFGERSDLEPGAKTTRTPKPVRKRAAE